MRKNTESHLKSEILRVIGARSDCRVWNAPVGQAWTRTGAPVRFGLKGCADIIGVWRRYVPYTHGIFLAIECKSDIGKQRPEQVAFERMVREFGGVYILARSVQDVLEVLDK